MMEPGETPQSLKSVKHVILVLSGKGGVGKSSVTTQLALSLLNKGFKVGVLDIDLTGPSMPRMFGLEDKKLYQSSHNGWIPAYYDNTKQLAVSSIGFLLNNRGNSVVWRGPKKTGMIRQFMRDMDWGDLDYLLIDTPPGTSDEHIAIAEELRYCKNVDGCVIVTTPQLVSVNDVKKEINFCGKVNFKILGILENMSGFICPYCSECTNIFGSGGGKRLAEEVDLPYLGNVPIDPQFTDLIERQTELTKEKGQNLMQMYQDCGLSAVFGGILKKVTSSSA
ncbi:cytosolic Fe-S cluster assembly factor cfd1 [Brettanomyces nanus]|uniref:Cytosolic Fe-S cluster assembly factor cfd1 n=1 Tax=Eeniella nana TaxID=13502 RepID=A0A875S272_EENNA|nr:cytosolic Fe-S cluster assembly factor cfd1 [Brettanomyces nanus]QPG74425.1 cytosolic Fe-S cluster assembly factor cfd1 [Brettanomyces nanus]